MISLLSKCKEIYLKIFRIFATLPPKTYFFSVFIRKRLLTKTGKTHICSSALKLKSRIFTQERPLWKF